jgi:FG-GAP-like repeat
VNGDGKIDVVSEAKSGPQGNWFAWWEHPAVNPTEPWKKHLIAADQPGATNILVADLNGDGKPDFVASRGHGKGVVWFEAPNWKPHELDTTLVGTHGLAVGDIDGDGSLDVVTCAKDSGVLAWFQNDGKGHFTEHRIYEDQSTYEVRLVDMNGDGALDILVAGQESGNVVWYENRLRKGRAPDRPR